ncbi:hypothetical protein GCM10023219_14980 [Stakelama sediminis]
MSVFAPSLRTLFIASAAALACLSAPAAFAMDRGDLSNQQTAKVTVEHRDGKTLYCVTQEAVTGSRIQPQTCLTKQQWADRGAVIHVRGKAPGAVGEK